MEPATKSIMKTSFAAIVLGLAVLFRMFGIGDKPYLGFGNLSTYLFFVGFVSVASLVVHSLPRRKQVQDERSLYIGDKANRIVFLAIIILSFIIMILDGITPITLPYSLFMGYLVCSLLLIYVISYKILSYRY